MLPSPWLMLVESQDGSQSSRFVIQCSVISFIFTPLQNAPGKAGRPRKVSSVDQLARKACLLENLEANSLLTRQRFAALYGQVHAGDFPEDATPLPVLGERTTRSMSKKTTANSNSSPGLDSATPRKKRRSCEDGDDKESIRSIKKNKGVKIL